MEKTRDIAVERAVLVSELIRSEPGLPDVSQDDATQFVKNILLTCNICTVSNVKLCNAFISKYILPSNTRIAALLKYLTLISMSFGPRDLDRLVDTTKPLDSNTGLGRIINGRVQQPPHPAFQRLHILYIVNDMFCHMMSHVKAAQARIREHFRAKVCTLLELAVCYCCGSRGVAAQVRKKVEVLIHLWEVKAKFDPSTCKQLRDNISLAAETEWDSLVSTLKFKDGGNRAKQQRRELAEWRSNHLPMTHGVTDDPTAPWHELPAANGLYMLRTQGYPLRSRYMPLQGYPIEGGGQEPDSALRRDVSNVYNDMIRCYDRYTNAEEVQDIDPLGNIIWKDPERSTRNMWGFSLEGIEKRKEIARRFVEATRSDGGGGRDAVERARALAGDRGGGMRDERGGARGGFRGGRRW